MMLKLFILGTILILPSFCDALFGNVFQGIGGAIENTLLGGSSAIKDAIFGNCNPAFCKEVGSIYSTCSHSSNSSQKIINAVDLISSNMANVITKFTGECSPYMGQIYDFMKCGKELAALARQNRDVLKIGSKLLDILFGSSILTTILDTLLNILKGVKTLGNSSTTSAAEMEDMCQKFLQEVSSFGVNARGTDIESQAGTLLCFLSFVLDHTSSFGCEDFIKQTSSVYTGLNFVSEINTKISVMPDLGLFFG